jgi:hypothetical protein
MTPSATNEEPAMPDKGSMHWERSAGDLTARFEATIDGIDGLERRKMFGEMAGFVGGNLVTGLHAGRWFVRLPEASRAEALLLDGATLFAPMPGRPMKEYVVLPPFVLEDEAALSSWLERAVAYGSTLPPKK